MLFVRRQILERTCYNCATGNPHSSNDGGTHQGAVSHAHFDYYLDEYTFRFNRRKSRYRGKLFYRLLQNDVAVDPVPNSEIRKGVRGQKPKKHKI